MPSSKKTITFLLQLSPVCQPSGMAAQAHASARQPSSLLLRAPNLEEEQRGQMGSAALLDRLFLSFNLGGNRRAEEGEPL